VIAIVLGGLPFAASGIIMDHHAPPAFTLDICHPLATCNVAHACNLPPLAGVEFIQRTIDLGTVGDYAASSTVRGPQAPDPPPPRSYS
jgi:hypothetical protein